MSRFLSLIFIVACFMATSVSFAPLDPVQANVSDGSFEQEPVSYALGNLVHLAPGHYPFLAQVATYTTNTGAVSPARTGHLLQRLATGKPLVWGGPGFYVILLGLYVLGLAALIRLLFRIPGGSDNNRTVR